MFKFETRRVNSTCSCNLTPKMFQFDFEPGVLNTACEVL